jgi:hypothetical protein
MIAIIKLFHRRNLLLSEWHARFATLGNRSRCGQLARDGVAGNGVKQGRDDSIAEKRGHRVGPNRL